MEIGTYNGKHALKMIETAKKIYGKKVEYFGFDLFEIMNKNILKKEISKKPITKEETRKLLKTTGCKINLYKGFTEITLPQNIEKLPKMDLIFIDGGHSLKTIKNDWHYSRQLMHKNTVLIFDDYWNRDNVGCKKIIKGIDKDKYSVRVLPLQDWYPKKMVF
jgi:predicted O-methyltransferase YrrM